MFWKYLLWEFLATVCSRFAMFSFPQILTRTFQAVLWAFHIISSQQSSPHTSSLVTSSGTKEHRRCCWSRRANIRWTVCPQLLIHLYLREAIKGFVSMQHWPHWPIYHSKNRTTGGNMERNMDHLYMYIALLLCTILLCMQPQQQVSFQRRF